MASSPDTRRIVYMPIDEIVRADANPKRHNDNGLVVSIEQFGAVDAMIYDERTQRLIGGHGRLDTFTRLRDEGHPPPEGLYERDGRWFVPVQRGWASRDDDEAKAVLIGLNQHVLAGGWDTSELVRMLGEISVEPLAIGFTDRDIELMRAQILAVGGSTIDDVAPITPPADPVTRPGDLWLIGRHRLICGDARDAFVWKRMCDGALVNVAFTSPPYADRRVYDEASAFEPVSPAKYVEWFEPTAANVMRHLADDGSWFVNIRAGAEGLDKETYVLDLVLAHIRAWGWHWAEEFCWERVGVPKAPTMRLKNQWESVFQFTRGRWKFRPDNVRHYSENVPVAGGPGVGDTNWADDQGTRRPMFGAKKKRKRPATGSLSDWQGANAAPGDYTVAGLAYPGNRLPPFSGSHDATGHTAAFPVGLPAWFLRCFSDVGDVVADPFAGSGSTLLAAEAEGRIGMGIEISPAYCDVIIDRMRRVGVEATRSPA